MPSQSQCVVCRATSGTGAATRPEYCSPSRCCSGSPASRHSALAAPGAPAAGLPGPTFWRLRQLSIRLGSPDGPGLSSTRQYMVLAERKTSEVPLSRARSAARRIGSDQYSSWPGKTSARCREASTSPACRSVAVA